MKDRDKNLRDWARERARRYAVEKLANAQKHLRGARDSVLAAFQLASGVDENFISSCLVQLIQGTPDSAWSWADDIHPDRVEHLIRRVLDETYKYAKQKEERDEA